MTKQSIRWVRQKKGDHIVRREPKEFFFNVLFKQIVRKDGGVRREPKEIKKAEKSMKPKILQNIQNSWEL